MFKLDIIFSAQILGLKRSEGAISVGKSSSGSDLVGVQYPERRLNKNTQQIAGVRNIGDIWRKGTTKRAPLLGLKVKPSRIVTVPVLDMHCDYIRRAASDGQPSPDGQLSFRFTHPFPLKFLC